MRHRKNTFSRLKRITTDAVVEQTPLLFILLLFITSNSCGFSSRVYQACPLLCNVLISLSQQLYFVKQKLIVNLIETTFL